MNRMNRCATISKMSIECVRVYVCACVFKLKMKNGLNLCDLRMFHAHKRIHSIRVCLIIVNKTYFYYVCVRTEWKTFRWKTRNDNVFIVWMCFFFLFYSSYGLKNAFNLNANFFFLFRFCFFHDTVSERTVITKYLNEKREWHQGLFSLDASLFVCRSIQLCEFFFFLLFDSFFSNSFGSFCRVPLAGRDGWKRKKCKWA